MGKIGVDDIKIKTLKNLANKIHKKVLADLKELSKY